MPNKRRKKLIKEERAENKDNRMVNKAEQAIAHNKILKNILILLLHLLLLFSSQIL